MKSNRLLLAFLLSVTSTMAQSRPRDMAAILERPLNTPDVVSFQLRQYLYQRIPRLPAPGSAAQWTAEAERNRKHLLADVVFHGCPRASGKEPQNFHYLATI